MKTNPLISIVIPVYNGSDFLACAIDSALSQTYENVEVLVVNDGSKDDGKTEEIAKSYGDKIRYFYKENGGVSSALNLGIKNMRGEYFSWLSHDDFYHQDKIKESVKALENYEDDVLCLCNCQYVNFEGTALNYFREYEALKVNDVNDNIRALTSIFTTGSFNGCSLLIPKKVLDEVGEFDEKLHYCQDFYMWVKIFLSGYKLVYIDTPLVYGRIHDKQLTQTGRDLFYSDSFYCADYVCRRLVSEYPNTNLLYLYAKRNAVQGNSKVVKKCLKDAKGKKILSLFQRVSIKVSSFYGKIRPLIRKLYYKLFFKVKTQ